MQTVLFAREIGSMMKWDGDSKRAVNTHFGKVNETRQALGYLDALTIDDVLKSVLMATLTSLTTSLRYQDRTRVLNVTLKSLAFR